MQVNASAMNEWDTRYSTNCIGVLTGRIAHFNLVWLYQMDHKCPTMEKIEKNKKKYTQTRKKMDLWRQEWFQATQARITWRNMKEVYIQQPVDQDWFGIRCINNTTASFIFTFN